MDPFQDFDTATTVRKAIEGSRLPAITPSVVASAVGEALAKEVAPIQVVLDNLIERLDRLEGR